MVIAGNRIWKPMFSPNCTRDSNSASSIRLIYVGMERESIARGWWADDTLAKWLARHVAERPASPAVTFQQQVLTWQQIGERVSRTANGLTLLGVSRGDVVAVQLPNVPEFIVSYLAITR